MTVHDPINPRVQTSSAALGVYIDQLGIRQDVTYLVNNGVEVNDAVNRIVEYRRKSMLVGISAMPVLFWSGIFIGFGIYRGLPGFVLGRVLELFLGVLMASLGTLMAYALVMTQFRLWRRTCAGIPWEQSRNRWLPSVRPKNIRTRLAPEPGDTGRKVSAALLGAFVLSIWILPIVGGTFSALITILGVFR